MTAAVNKNSIDLKLRKSFRHFPPSKKEIFFLFSCRTQNATPKRQIILPKKKNYKPVPKRMTNSQKQPYKHTPIILH